jgi:UDP-N-acetylmuramate dehydrogenase
MTAVPVSDTVRRLRERLPSRVTERVPVADLTTYRLGGPLAVLVRPRSVEDLLAVADVLADQHAPVLVIGRGSNLLVADEGFDGVGIVLSGEFETIEVESGGGAVTAGGGVALPILARRAAAAGKGGLEFFVGIPGSVGGAVRMNAGGHGRETVDVLVTADVVDLFASTPALETCEVEALGLGYRSSRLGAGGVVCRARFRVSEAESADAESLIDEIVRWRRDNQPGGANAGSVFRNPPGDAAGRVIEAAGCKGLRVGGAEVSSKHANFFQADPGASASDVRGLVEAVQARVRAQIGIELVPELRMVGFEDPA